MSGLGDIVDVLLVEMAKRVSNNDINFINEVKLSPYEIKAINSITPYYIKILITLGMNTEYINALFVILPIIIPKIFAVVFHK